MLLLNLLAVCAYHLNPPPPETAAERYNRKLPTALITIPEDSGSSQRSA